MRKRIQSYTTSPIIQFAYASEYYDIWERRDIRREDLANVPLKFAFLIQGSFTVCIMDWKDGDISVGVTRRCAGNKGLMKAADRVAEVYFPLCKRRKEPIKSVPLLGRLISKVRKAAKGDPEDQYIGKRIAFARAVDNHLKGYCDA